MKTSFTDLGPLSKKLELVLEKADYLANYQEELRKVQSGAAIKGFRKGKTPKNFVEKMYGRSILADAVNKTIEKKLWDAIEEEKLKVILSPLISLETPRINFDIKNMEDYTFIFELGQKPEIKLSGADSSSSISHVVIEPDEEIVNKELDLARKRMGGEEKVEKNIQKEDRVTIEASELDAKGKVKKGGHESTFQVLVSTMDDEYVSLIEGKDVGEAFEFDIYKIEKNRQEKYVRKYLLNLEDESEVETGSKFKGIISEISRVQPAELNEEFFLNYLGKEDGTEEEAKALIRENISKYYEGQSRAFLHRNIMDKLVAENEFDMPKEFIKNWLVRNNENLTEEQIDSEIEPFITNMKWDLITDEIKELYKVEVLPEDVRAKIRLQIMQYFGGQAPGMDLEPLIDNLMKDETQFRQAYTEASAEKMLETVAQNITLVEEKISIEKFGEMVKEMNEKLEKR